MKFYDKYRHVGYSYPGVPQGWVKITEDVIRKIEAEMWPRWMPMFLKRWIHYLATGNSVVRVKYWWAYNLRTWLTGGQVILDVKEKYATLRIYVSGNDKVDKIITEAEEQCERTCQECESTNNVECVDYGWVYNLCADCRNKKEQIIKERSL